MKRLATATAIALGLLACATPRRAPAEPQYLVFQLTTYVANADGRTDPLEPERIAREIDAIVAGVGGRRGDGVGRQLGFAVGPITFDHDDDAVRETIRMAFRLAREKGVAVALHLDDSMFWKRRRDLWEQRENVEWLDWNGPPSRARKIDWGRPLRLAPQMCVNAPAIRAAVAGRARDVIGATVAEELARLRAAGREWLFAGVIAGWETQLGRDFDSDRPVGFCALTNRGFRADAPPTDPDREREEILRDFIGHWAQSLASGGVPSSKIYSHVAFVPRATYTTIQGDRPDLRGTSYSQALNFAPPGVAFASGVRPGFSTYPAPGVFDDVYAALAAHGNPPWASCEGTNLVIGGRRGDSGLTMEGYLARVFAHGGRLVTLFGWGVGGENRSNPFRQETESPEAFAAYRKFLDGGTLTDAAAVRATSPDQVAAKIHRVQRELPSWLRAGGDESLVASHLEAMQQAMEAGRFADAERHADAILERVATAP